MSETRQTVFRQTKEEYEELKRDAHAHNMNVSEYIRYLVAKERKERAIQKDIEKSFEESEKDFEDFIKRYGRVRTPQNDEVRE
jgi:hypothetical protein